MPCKLRKKYLSKRHWCPCCEHKQVKFNRDGDRHGYFKCLKCGKIIERNELMKVN